MTDLYTKTILTVIAACLVWLCVTGAMPTALAQTAPPPPTRVLLVDERNVPLPTAQGLRVNVGTQALPVSVTNPSFAVTVMNPSTPVTLTAIQRQGIWEPIDVRVLREPPSLMPIP